MLLLLQHVGSGRRQEEGLQVVPQQDASLSVDSVDEPTQFRMHSIVAGGPIAAGLNATIRKHFNIYIVSPHSGRNICQLWTEILLRRTRQPTGKQTVQYKR